MIGFAFLFVGTGNVLKVQEMLHLCSVHVDKEKADDTYQMFAVIGIALIAMGEDIGSQMAVRQFNHLVRYMLSSMLICMIYLCVFCLDALWGTDHSKGSPVGFGSNQCFQSAG